MKSISTTLLQIPTDENKNVAICQAVVEMQNGRTFSGIGDAAPNNVARPMQNVLLRMAETRAKARALRDAVNIGAAALEELDGGDNHDNEQDLRSNNQPLHARLVSSNGQNNATRPATNTVPAAINPDNTGMATDKQLQAIYNIAYKRLFMNEDELETRVQKMFGVAIEKLSRGDASQLIKTLNENVA